jgi:DNA-binding beta-propeller fold protein YncE
MLQLSTKQYNAMIRPGFYRWRATWLLLLLLSSVLLGLRESLVLAAPRAVEAPPTYRTQWGSLGSSNGQFNRPFGVATDSSGNVYVADTANQRVQKFTSNGAFVSAISGQFSNPYGLATDSSGNLYVTNLGSHQIQKYNSSGNFLALIGSQGSGIGQLSTPVGVATDSSGNVYVADTNNHRIQKFNSNGNYLSQFGFQGNGNGQFNRPTGVAVDSSGNLYVIDSLNQRIQKFNSAGAYLTQWGGSGSGDGRFNNPSSVALDSSGNVYVVDSGNHRIQKFTNNGVYLSQWGSNGSGNGQFANPVGVAIDGSGAIYVTEFNNHRVQVFGYGPVVPEIEVRGNGFTIANGDSTPSTHDHTDFGTTPASSGALVRTFTIANTGSAALTIGTPTLTGAQAADFTLSRSPASNVAGGGSTTFDITFDPTAAGLRTATVTISNNDSDENPTTFAIQGVGSPKHPLTTAVIGDGVGSLVFNPPGGLYDHGTVVTVTANLASWSVLSGWGGACSGAGACVLTMDDAKRITATITYAEPSNAEAPPPYRMSFGGRGAGAGQLSIAFGVAVDSIGNVYVADTSNHRMQKFSAGGAFLLQWGSSGSGNGQFASPIRVAVDGSNNVYVVDASNNRIQKFDSNGLFLTKWGSYGAGNGQFNGPVGVAVDSSGNVYVVDSFNYRIQKFDSNGVYLTKWGTSGSGPGQFNSPRAVAVDSSGNVYVLEQQNHRVQKFDSNGLFLAQWGTRGKKAGQFDYPESVSVDSSDNVYVLDSHYNNRIQKFTSAGAFLTQWGAFGNGLGFFHFPTAVAVDGSGNVYVTESHNYRVQRFGTDAPIPEIEIQGNDVTILSGDSTPDSSDNTDFGYVPTGSTVVRTFAIRNVGSADLTNVAVTVSGNPAFSLSTPPAVTISSGYTATFGLTFAAGSLGPVTATVTIASNDSDEAAYTFILRATTVEAPPPYLATVGASGSGNGQFFYPYDVAVDGSGNLYVADTNNHRIQKFDSNGNFLLKWGTQGTGDGQFYTPESIAVDGSGNVYVTETSNHRIQKFDSNGNFLLKWGSYGGGNGQFTGPNRLAVDSSGNVYAIDRYTSRVQKFDSNGVYLAKWGSYGSGDGQSNRPNDVAVDASGNCYVVDTLNHRILKFDSNGNFLTKWGSNGAGPGQFFWPDGVAVDGSGNVYITDQYHRVQKFDSNGAYRAGWGSGGSGNDQFSQPVGLAVDGNGRVYVADRGNSRIQIFGVPTPSPEIDVRGNGIAIASGDTTPAGADHTDFGSVAGNGSTIVRTFAIHNIGTAALTGIAATLSGDAAFSLSTLPAATISATKSTTFTIAFAPSARSVLTTVVSIANSDSNENPYTFVIRGARVNAAPVAVNGALTTNEDTAQSVTLPASDGDSDALSYAIVGNPANGTVTVVGNTATYTPTANFNGSDSFTFQANDGASDSNVATIAVTVNSVNDAPQTRILTRPLNPSTADVSFTFSGSDLDGTVTAFECKVDSAAFAPCSSPHAYNGLSVGSHTFLVRAVDNSGAVDGSPARYTWNVAAGSASITIELALTPQITNNVRFTGTLGTFFLDDGSTDDGDAYGNSRLFPVAAGSYTINMRLFAGWLLTDLTCTPAAGAVIDRANQRVTLTVTDGDAVTCRFTSQRAAKINARAYEDRVRNGLNLGRKNNADPLLPGVTVQLYLSPTTSLVGSATTLGYSATITEARFSELPAGAYVLCADWAAGWTATDPNPALPLAGYAGQACKAVTVQPGQAATLFFGAYPPAVVSSALDGDETEPFETDQIIDLPLEAWPDDAQPEESDIIEEGAADDATTPVARRSFLPLVVK